jgi:peptidoglycan hydrolase-like protein with peptidoglycan-binding domain
LYNDVNNASGLQIADGNIFASIRSTPNTKALLLAGGTTTTVTTFDVNGTNPSNRVILLKTGGGANPILTKSSGTVQAQYLSITNIAATGGATWTAIDSLDNGGNTGWIFTSSSTGFFVFF